MNQINLFEYKWNNDIPATLTEEHFENYLDDIWKNRPKVKNWYTDQIDEIETDKNKQRFIQFRTKEFSSRNIENGSVVAKWQHQTCDRVTCSYKHCDNAAIR